MDNLSIESLSTTLEAHIDRHGLHPILRTLTDICNAKAEHLRTNWPEEVAAAKRWDKDADTIARATLKLKST
jgi:hypothetical protein